MAEVSFDELEQVEEVSKNDRPLWTIKLDDPKNEDNILKWLNGEIDFLKLDSLDRLQEMRRHLAMYKNVNFSDKVAASRSTQQFYGQGKSTNIKRMTINHTFDLVEQHVAKLVKFKPAVAILPTNDEWEDKVSAKISEKFWSHIKELQKFDLKNVDVVRSSKIGGQAFLQIIWDENAGGEHPKSEEARAEKKQFITVKNENGDPATDELGNVIRIELPIKIGDVTFKVIHPWDILIQKSNSWEDADYVLKSEVVSIDDLRLEYPNKAKDIKVSKGTKLFDMERQEEITMANQTIKWTLWHRRTKGLPKGREIVFIKDTILENHDLPYDHGKIPLVRFPDIIVPGQRNALSFIKNIRQALARYNDLTTMIIRNQALMAHPKWFVPRGSVKIEALGNDASIVQFQGAQAPVLGQQNPTPSEVFNFRERLKEDFQQISGISGVSRGEPPKGIEAGIALQFLEEQENQRFNASIVQYNEYIRQVAEMTLNTAAQFYSPDDKRTLMIMGHDGQWMIDQLDPSHLSKIFSIRILNSSALPESKSGRIQRVVDLNKNFPGIFTQEQVIEMLDLPNAQKFIDAATAAVKKAELEDEKTLSEGKSESPNEWEFHIQHWMVHSKTMQGAAFTKATAARQEMLKDHIMAHEMLMMEKAKISPSFAQKIQSLQDFPLLFTPPPPPPVMPNSPMPDGAPQQEQQIPPGNAGIAPLEGQGLEQAIPAPDTVPINGGPEIPTK